MVVVIVNPNTVSAAKPATAGSPNIVTEFVAVWAVAGAANTNAFIAGLVDDKLKGNPFLEVILNKLPPTTTGSTCKLALIICVLSPFNISTTSLSLWGAAVLTV